MITPENYLSQIAAIDMPSLPEPLRKGHEFLMKATEGGSDWSNYQSSAAIKKTIDLYFERLGEFVKVSPEPVKQANPSGTEKRHVKPPGAPVPAKKSKAVRIQKRPAQDVQPSQNPAVMVEKLQEELRFIRRYLNLGGKTKTKEEILRFLNTLQKAILEKRIRKTSAYAQQIRHVQQRLIEVYNTMKTKVKLELAPGTLQEFKQLVASEKVLASIGFIKRYISLHGKTGVKDKAKALLTNINQALDAGKLSDTDPYITEIHEIKKNLKSFVVGKGGKTLQIEQATLNGLEGILGCNCNSLSGLGRLPTVMNSVDFARVQFDTLGFSGKWLELIGDPSRGFTAMVYGRPKMGKSYLCMDFAGYLARNHGRVLYVAKEEGLDMTLQKKLEDKAVAHPDLFVSSILPGDLSAYDFIFLDSVSRLGLQPEDLNKLKVKYPGKSFIFIFQSTKQGKFRGANSFQHDVDVVIEVPEKGKAVQFGRFNQGGEIPIFGRE